MRDLFSIGVLIRDVFPAQLEMSCRSELLLHVLKAQITVCLAMCGRWFCVE